MKKFLTEDEFKALQPRLETGSARILVSKSIARQFFLRVANDSIIETAGESMRTKKAVIWLMLAIGINLMLATLILITIQSGWGAALAVPLVGIFWTVIAGFTSHLGNWIHSVIGLILGIGLALMLPAGYAVPLAMLTLSLVSLRAANEIAQYWVTALLSRSYPAYDMMVEHIALEVHDPAS